MSEPTRFTLRIPVALYEWLKAEATRENRSLHGQILHLLTKAKEGTIREMVSTARTDD